MNTINSLYNQVSSPYLGVLLAILLILPSILTSIIFKPKNKVNKSKNAKNKLEGLFTVVENISRIASIITLCLSKNSFDIKNANLWFGIMLFFFILYYELFIRYIINGCAYKNLYSPFMYIKVPMAVFASLGLIFAAIWGNNIILLIFSIIFAISHIYCAYKIYYRNFTEYRDLYDNNRKSVGKKILKGNKVPKGLNYVTVAVFIYNKKNNKWLMQKRTKDKGGKWATTSGHPVSGQSSIEGMVSEIKEELGLEVSEQELKFISTIKRKDKFVDIYYLESSVDIENLVIQQSELTDVTWMSNSEIEKLNRVDKFKNTHYIYYKEMLKNIDNNSEMLT